MLIHELYVNTMTDANELSVNKLYGTSTCFRVSLDENKAILEENEELYNTEMLGFDKKRKKKDLDINRNNTPSPVELKKMKLGSIAGVGTSVSYRLINNPHLVQFVSFDDAYNSYLANLKIDIPDCQHMFPWLHDFEDSKTVLDINNNKQLETFKKEHTTIIKTFSQLQDEKTGDLLIENSGILKGSLNSRGFFKELQGSIKPDLKNIVTQEINFYNTTMASLDLKEWAIRDEKDLNLVYNICDVLNIVPILKSDSIQVDKESPAFLYREKQMDPSFYRRFDLQPCKMLLLSSNILLYCYHDNHNECEYCNGFKLILQFSYYNLVSNYGIFGTLGDADVFEKIMLNISIVDMSSSYDAHPFIGTPMLSLRALEKPEYQLMSKFDSYIINNWEKDLFYREKLEISKISSNSSIDDNIWMGNSIDYEISKMGLVLNIKSKDYYSIENSICGVDPLNVEAVNDNFLFNFPQSIWDVFVQCKPIFENEYKLFDIPSIVAGLKDNRNIQLEFPSSGTLGLGNLTLQLIKQIFQCVDFIYQFSKKYQRKVLLYSQDGYSESSFLLLAYIIYSQSISLKEAIIYAHRFLKRPFFIFPNDLEILNYLQILLLSKSSEKDTLVKEGDINLERFEITNDDFTNMFFNTPVLSSTKSDLNSLINLKGPLPSQILEYLYLGSLRHADNLDLLKSLEINAVISVGEKLSWLNEEDFAVTKNEANNVHIYKSESMSVYHVDNLLDNGQDPLLHSLNDVLKFIEEQRRRDSGSKILVHCMVGVSRSATVVIAEVMKELKLSLVRAYMFVRVRRLNIIIQPNLLFIYELLKYEEYLITQLQLPLKGVPEGCKRSIDWAGLSKSIDELNENYLGASH